MWCCRHFRPTTCCSPLHSGETGSRFGAGRSLFGQAARPPEGIDIFLDRPIQLGGEPVPVGQQLLHGEIERGPIIGAIFIDFGEHNGVDRADLFAVAAVDAAQGLDPVVSRSPGDCRAPCPCASGCGCSAKDRPWRSACSRRICFRPVSGSRTRACWPRNPIRICGFSSGYWRVIGLEKSSLERQGHALDNLRLENGRQQAAFGFVLNLHSFCVFPPLTRSSP